MCFKLFESVSHRCQWLNKCFSLLKSPLNQGFVSLSVKSHIFSELMKKSTSLLK